MAEERRGSNGWDRAGLAIGGVGLVVLVAGLLAHNGPMVIGGFLALFLAACMLGLAF